MKPIIGISMQYNHELPRYDMSAEYAEAVAACGGIPVLIPYLAEENVRNLLGLCHGLLFSGGQDIAPERYSGTPIPECGQPDPNRDAAELLLFRLAAERKMPILGICRGIQLINVALGGTLHQHIPGHRDTVHTITVSSDSLLYPITGSSCTVNSYHHQILDNLGQGLKVIARGDGGEVEAVESTEYPFLLGVQWHPERSLVREGNTISRMIIERFIRAAAGR